MAMPKLKNLAQGAMGNASVVDVEDLTSEFSDYLFDDEVIHDGYKLIRDVIIFTDYRILVIDKQGATGKKTSVRSIYLSHVIDVLMETGGSGLDDVDLVISYLDSVNRRALTGTTVPFKMSFPKSMDITPLYRNLGSLVLANRNEINEI